MIYAPSGTAFLTFLIMLFVALFNFINTALLFSGNGWMIPMLAIAFLLPFFLFRATRGGKKYLPTVHLSLPKYYHIPTIIFSTLLIILGSTFLKLIFVEGKYTEFFRLVSLKNHSLQKNKLIQLWLLLTQKALTSCASYRSIEMKGSLHRWSMTKHYLRRWGSWELYLNNLL